MSKVKGREIQYWRVFYNRLDGSLPNHFDIVAETADEARKEAENLGYVTKAQDIAGLKPLNEEQEGREVKTVWKYTNKEAEDE